MGIVFVAVIVTVGAVGVTVGIGTGVDMLGLTEQLSPASSLCSHSWGKAVRSQKTSLGSFPVQLTLLWYITPFPAPNAAIPNTLTSEREPDNVMVLLLITHCSCNVLAKCFPLGTRMQFATDS